jgi:hypothetical protein
MEKEAVTIRFPSDLLQKAKQLKESGESFNELVIEALEREVKRRKGIATHHRILARRQEIKAKTGVQPNSTALIRSLREGKGRRE